MSESEKHVQDEESLCPPPSKRPRRRTHRRDTVHVFVNHELKDRLEKLAEKYDRTSADMVRAILRIGIPMMEALSGAEEIMVREYIELFRDLRQVRSLRDI